ncbi:sigma-70 family RNA polymerase sigma factor [Paenibacillus sp. IHBB 3054]|uniref:sigma-70 family RNA polymerase sigma factor n=1 Tax=Paenibacillus sp. IHBB 3054 TaxID=3425689 RepID=UPI003F66883C
MNNGQEDQIRRAQAGDSEAFIQLVKGLERQMYSMAKSIVRNDEDSADVMQETVMKAYKALSGLKEPAFFNTWLFRILINECNMILRRRDRVVVMSEPPEHLLVSSSFGEDMDLRNAVSSLEEISRTIVILHYYQGVTLQEIAGLLELSESAVKTRLHRARKTLYESLAEPAERKMNG